MRLAGKLGIPTGTVLARAKREGWTQAIEKAKAFVPQQSKAITPGNATASVIANLGRESRLALGRLHKASAYIANLKGAEIVAQADKVSSLTKASTTVFGWQDEVRMPLLRLELIAGIPDIPPPLEMLDAETGERV